MSAVVVPSQLSQRGAAATYSARSVHRRDPWARRAGHGKSTWWERRPVETSGPCCPLVRCRHYPDTKRLQARDGEDREGKAAPVTPFKNNGWELLFLQSMKDSK